MNNFCVFGDSYAYRNDSNPNTWIPIVAKTFDHDSKIVAVPGSGQDWAFGQIYHYRHVISSKDKVVVILSEPGRRWLFKDRPDHSNIYVANYKDVLTNEQSRVLESYIKYVQDDNLDNLAMINRLGWLDSLVARCWWHKPLIIRAFDMHIDEHEYPNLTFARGALSTISKGEVVGDYQSVIQGKDFRYNHLCLSNHTVLARKIVDYFTSGYPPDLTTEFKTNILTKDFYKDHQFISDELYPEAVNRWISNVQLPI